MPLLKILSSSEIIGFDSPPIFNYEERKRFFSLPSGLKQLWRKLRTAENQTLFCLQLGYFRSRQKFFAGHFYSEDFEFIKRKYGFSFSSDEPPVYSRPTIARHQHIINTWTTSELSGVFLNDQSCKKDFLQLIK